MDERAAPSPEVEDHRRTCPICTQFEAGAWRIREVARFEVAPPVPDMVPAIMAKVRDEEADRLLGWGPPSSPVRGWLSWLIERRAAVVGAATGVILGLVLTSGGLVPIGRVNTVALASEIPHELVRAASGLEGYQATFDVAESNWTKAVPNRTFVATVDFMAPESFRVRVKDTTNYPPGSWPRNDLSLVTDGRTWEASGPDPCPSANLPACPTDGPVTRSIVDRPPFDARAAMPSDVIVPMTVLAASDKVVVNGQDRVAGRGAITVELTYQDATPLFQYLTFLGSWRPFFPQDRVVVWLDRGTWFPLRYEVLPAAGGERSMWASGLGLPAERPSEPVFTAEAVALSTDQEPPAGTFRVGGGGALDEGFRDGPVPDPSSMTPAWTAGLPVWRTGRFDPAAGREFGRSVVAFARGLSWISVIRVTGWTEGRPFGVGPFAEPVSLPTGVGYYEAASVTDPRRVALHTAEGELRVESNLSRGALLRVAGSLPVPGLPQPASWRIHRWSAGMTEDGLTVREGIEKAVVPVLLPGYLPAGYRAAA